MVQNLKIAESRVFILEGLRMNTLVSARSQVCGIDRSRFPGRRTVGKLGEEEDEKGEPAI